MKHRIEIGGFFCFLFFLSAAQPICWVLKKVLTDIKSFSPPWERHIIENTTQFPFSFGALKYKSIIFLSSFKITRTLNAPSPPLTPAPWADYIRTGERGQPFGHQFFPSVRSEGSLMHTSALEWPLTVLLFQSNIHYNVTYRGKNTLLCRQNYSEITEYLIFH